MKNRILLILMMALALVGAFLAIPQPASAAVPSAPASCSLTGSTLTWTAPSSTGGNPIQEYRIREVTYTDPLVTVGPTVRSYNWTDAPRTTPLSLSVRAKNASGPGPTCTATAAVTPPPAALPCQASSFYRDDVRNNTVDAARTTAFKSFMASNAAQAGITYPKVNVNDDWSGINHVSKAGDPIWKLVGAQSEPQLDILRTQGFHLQDSVLNLNPTGAQDRLLVVYDPIFGYVAQMADTVPNFSNHTITASSAGIDWYNTDCLDDRNPAATSTLNWSSRGRIVPSMQVPAEFLQDAIDNGTGIGYVMHLFFVETDGLASPCFQHPMVGCEGDQRGWGAEGTRIRINPTIDLATRGLTSGCLALARTLQENGAYLGDNSGSSTQLKVGNPNQYPASMGLSANCMSGKVSWNDFQVVTLGQQ